jgi:tRNA (guanine-N7-)-methyltransferase
MSETSSHQPNRPLRRVRSFVRREGRLTAGQQKALDELWPRYGLAADTKPDFATVFGRRAALTLEIGFGNGASLADMAEQDPDTDYVGIEVHRPGVGHLLKLVDERGLGNVRVFCADAVEILTSCFDDHSLDRVLLFFPDPWPKTRHHKRRLVQPAFVELLARKLKAGAILHMATDWQHYAAQMLRLVDAAREFSNLAGAGNYSPRPAYRPATRFERRGQRLGHGVWDLLYRRNDIAARQAPPD